MGDRSIEEPRFSYAAIGYLAKQIEDHNAAWRVYFERCDIEPVRVVYEEFVQDYEASVLGLLDDLGIPVPDGFVVAEPKMKKQADELSEEWVRRYHEQRAAETSGRPRKG